MSKGNAAPARSSSLGLIRRAGIGAACLLGAGMLLASTPEPAAPSDEAATPALFQQLPAREIASPAHVWSPEARFSGHSWQDIEKASLALADRQIGSFEGRSSGWLARPVRLHYRMYSHRAERRGAVVLVPGFTEGLTVYQELIHDLLRQGWSVYVHDHRGQGFSSRLLQSPDQASLGHLDQFDHLVIDLEQFLARVVQAREGRAGPLVALAHSMGGAVTSLHLARRGTASPLAAAALITPMHEPTVSPPGEAEPLRRWCDTWAVRLPFSLPLLSEQRATDLDFESERQAFFAAADPSRNDMSHSAERLKRRWADRMARCEGEHCGHGDARVAGPSLRWVAQACAGAREARSEAARNIRVPLLLLNGGQDTVVEANAQAEFCRQVNAAPDGVQRCRAYTLPRARHALLIESDDLRAPALDAVQDFFDAALRLAPADPPPR